MPLQEWNDERFGESTADGVIGFERKGDMRGRGLSVQQTDCETPNYFICKITEACARHTSSTPRHDAFNSEVYKVTRSETCVHQVC
jgi:hypothetical protein